ncbi:MAG TPA: TlpA disulfide reductase family protein [Steroidobacteraceae bacterium]|nr:TlpA disulfide reductase family protein [Steroidobacteraceae bacterium]
MRSARPGRCARRLTLAVGLLGCVVQMHAALAVAPPPIVGKDAPDFVAKTIDGSNLRLSEFRGQVVLVNFWARWASDSRQEMPALSRINQTYERAGLKVIGISIDDDLVRARAFADAMKLSYPVMLDAGPQIGRDYQLGKMPMTILVDRSGVIRYAHVGYRRGDDRVFLDHIRELLRE